MKKGVINNMFHTTETVCSGPEKKKESLTLAREIAVSNGYESERLKRDDAGVADNWKPPPYIRYFSAFLTSPTK
ncbi:hypothetical protein RB195_003549 [Necator americanus]|uniref:Helix-turn-helix domain-containing protein n=1 Tax=Necator americanus TaxID=51031 RepID=A0ABR1DP20_NECAM